MLCICFGRIVGFFYTNYGALYVPSFAIIEVTPWTSIWVWKTAMVWRYQVAKPHSTKKTTTRILTIESCGYQWFPNILRNSSTFPTTPKCETVCTIAFRREESTRLNCSCSELTIGPIVKLCIWSARRHLPAMQKIVQFVKLQRPILSSRTFDLLRQPAVLKHANIARLSCFILKPAIHIVFSHTSFDDHWRLSLHVSMPTASRFAGALTVYDSNRNALRLRHVLNEARSDTIHIWDRKKGLRILRLPTHHAGITPYHVRGSILYPCRE